MSETLTRNSKLYYEELFLQAGGLNLDELLFPTLDSNNSAAFLMDTYIETPYGIVYRNQNNQSHVRAITPGTGFTYTVPVSSSKTPITEAIRDAVQAGVEATADQATHAAALMRKIVSSHTSGHNMTRNKQAIDVLRDAVFYARGVDGLSIKEDIVLIRDGGMSTTYNFTTAGHTMAKILAYMLGLLRDKGCSLQNIVVLMGATWLAQYGSDTSIQDNKETNSANVLLMQGMFPALLRGVTGLRILGQCRPAGCSAPISVVEYNPGVAYTAYKGAAAAPWIPDNEAVMFSLDSPRYTVQRGVTVKAAGDRAMVTNGRIVFDSYTEDDPVTENIRSSTRHAFIAANCNHTCRCVGTF